MLDELRIRGLGVIDEAVLPLGPGLTAVTGETGAGKTMVITGLLLLFGGRGDTARVRTGQDQATVDGHLSDVPAAVTERVRDAGGEVEDGDLDLRRVLSSAGRSRAFVGGAPAPIGVLGDLAEQLVTVHGQADQLRLTRRADQLDLLDRFADLDRTEYAASYAAWRSSAATLAERTARAAELRREADLLSYGIGEIETVAPEPGEDSALAELAGRLMHADGLRAAAQIAHDALTGADDPAGDVADVGSLLGTARRALASASGADPQLDKIAGQLEDVTAATLDLGAELRDYTDALDADPQQLDTVQQRRSVLTTLVRKYGSGDVPDVASVLAWADDARVRLGELDVSDEAIAALTAQRDAAAAETVRLGEQLSATRRSAADTLAAAVTAELAGLAMSGASLSVQLTPRDPGPDGLDDVEILLQPHPQSPPLPLAKGASGGELSRVMLALEVSLAGTDPVPTMVFDEVDAGVGGRAAVEVGRRLARLARTHQVIVVTHLAQVAAYADRQIVVDKSARAGDDGVTATDVRVVADDDRITELARMLAGTDSATARDHATELLTEARADRETPPSKRPRGRAEKAPKSQS